MSAQHTPGPWVVEVFPTLKDAKNAGGFEWAGGWSSNSRPASVWQQCDGGGSTGLPGCIETTEANANLIAAAPELLEALELYQKIIGPPDAAESECWASTDEINAAWDMGTAAIAKAKGVTP